MFRGQKFAWSCGHISSGTVDRGVNELAASSCCSRLGGSSDSSLGEGGSFCGGDFGFVILSLLSVSIFGLLFGLKLRDLFSKELELSLL